MGNSNKKIVPSETKYCTQNTVTRIFDNDILFDDVISNVLID